MITDSDEALVRGAQSGDRAAFEEMVRRTSRLVFARLYLETGDAHRAEDLLQETLLAAFRSIRALDDPRHFRTWVLKIAQNTVLEAVRRDLRKKRAAPLQNDTVLNIVTAKDPSPEAALEHNERREHVLAVL